MDTSARLPVIVLAGGKSTRLGRDKASEVVAGKALLQHVVDACEQVASRILVVKAAGQELPELTAAVDLQSVDDRYPETGPIGGICTGLEALNQRESFATVVACDMPLLQPALIRCLASLVPGHEAVVPVKDGRPEPLCAAYSDACIEAARRLLDRGEYRVAALCQAVDVLLLAEPEWRALDPQGFSFLNVNRERDLEHARGLLEARSRQL